jgi:small GTP-binding protein
MIGTVLQQQQRDLLIRERQIAGDLQTFLAGSNETDAYRTTLQQVSMALEDLFLLVIVGEFNAGKSACINALLHAPVLEEGVIPTTQQVTMLRYGAANQHQQREAALLEISYPADFLQDISIVDTPGVNAVLREHERLTEDFVPRSDLILFVTSVDRPFTESERAFLQRIRNWGKKIVIILNKVDILQTPQALNHVLDFVRENCRTLLGFQPDIFPVSALMAQRAHQAVGHEAIRLWEQSRFNKLEEYLFKTLDQTERVRLKLQSPLGVMERVITQTSQAVEERATLLNEDSRTVSTIDEQLKLYQDDMGRNFLFRLNEVENIILSMRGRGDRFFDDTIRLGRIIDLVQSSRVREEFERDVIADSATRIDAAIQELIDWMVEQEHRLWQDIMEYLDRRRQVSARRDDQIVGSIGKQFDYNRRTLLQTVARTANTVLMTYDRQAEADSLSQSLRGAVTQTVLAGAGGIGLGAAVVAATSIAAIDITGILAGLVLVGLGLYVIPARRARAKQEFNEKMEELRQRLHVAMEEQFRKEMNNSMSRVHDAIAPYTRFVRAEQEKTGTMRQKLEQLGQQVIEIRGDIDRLKSE